MLKAEAPYSGKAVPERMPVASATRIDESTRAERHTALRALLRTPMMTPETAPEHFGLVRRHAASLREWVSTHTGWRLDVTAEYARLRKVPACLTDATHPARDPKYAQPFTRRRYVVLCLVLASLERADRQTTLGKLAESVLGLASADPVLARAGFVPQFKTTDERRDIVHVVRLLVSFGVLAQQDGEEQDYVHNRGDVLYRIRRSCLGAMLCATRSPSTISKTSLDDRLHSMTEQIAPESEEARNRALRWSITRRLLDDPVMYVDELIQEERAYLETQRPTLVRRVADATGLVPEVRREGIAMVDDVGELTDSVFTEAGTDAHVAMLVAERLARACRDRPGAAVSMNEIGAHIAGARAAFGSYWRQDAREPGSEALLACDAVERLTSMQLVKVVPDGVVPLPAIGRYRGTSVGRITGTSDEELP